MHIHACVYVLGRVCVNSNACATLWHICGQVESKPEISHMKTHMNGFQGTLLGEWRTK